MGSSHTRERLAEHILKGTRPYQVGRPLEIKFTALDGREVDLAKLVGKVVLVEFWATDCGPCIGEMPAVKAAYETLHGRGFEVVAISLDDKESALRRFVKEKELPWPQHLMAKAGGTNSRSNTASSEFPPCGWWTRAATCGIPKRASIWSGASGHCWRNPVLLPFANRSGAQTVSAALHAAGFALTPSKVAA